jgi:SAM-dependent MidA family methyltransferase
MYEFSHLPKPSVEHIQQSQLLVTQLRQRIQEKGPLRFDEYMQEVLYAPHLGYYRSNLEKLGAQGDFVTAPLISPLFSASLSQQLIEILASLKQKNIIEFGAGNGLMATQILQTLEKQQQLPDHYYIVELSAELAARQRKTISENLPHLMTKVSWLSSLENIAMEGVIVANEVLDAMPVHRFIIEENGVAEFYVDWQNDRFVFQLQPASLEIKNYLTQIALPFSLHYQSEVNLWLPRWIKSLDHLLTKGAIILIDYGFSRKEFYHPDRDQGTLMCHYQHYAHDDPLILPGLQDITAHVDFTQVAETAAKLGLNVAGFTTQANFLLNCGISEIATAELHGPSAWEYGQQLKKLLFPSEMGEIFKVIALTKGLEMSLLGFRQLDRRDYL